MDPSTSAPPPPGFSFLARPSYRPSGRLDVGRTTILLALALGVALGMARLLLALEREHYYFLVVPWLVGAPALGAAAATVRFGNCRNPRAGAAIGLMVLGCYYFGYWEMSRQRFRDRWGAPADLAIELVGGTGGLPGYFLYRCRTNVVGATNPGSPEKKAHEFGDELQSYAFFGGEAILLLVTGYMVCGRLSGGGLVFYERRGVWGRRFRMRWPAERGGEVVAALDRLDWEALSKLPRLPVRMIDPQKPAVDLRIHYLADEPAEPVFLHLTSAFMLSAPWIPLGAKKEPGQKFVIGRNLRFEPGEVEAIARAFPDFKEALRPPIESGGGLAALAGRLGLRPPRPAGPDFRERAVEASRAALARAGAFSRIDEAPTSFCIPAEGDLATEAEVRSSASLDSKLLLVLLLAGLLGGLAIAALGQTMELPALSDRRKNAVSILGLVLAFGSLLAMPLIPLYCRRRLGRRLLDRPGSLARPGDRRSRMVVGVEDAADFHRRSSHPSDFGLLILDPHGRRVLLEGATHRYLVRGEDLLAMHPHGDEETGGVHLEYRIGDERLSLVVTQRGATPSSPEKFEARIAEALGVG